MGSTWLWQSQTRVELYSVCLLYELLRNIKIGENIEVNLCCLWSFSTSVVGLVSVLVRCLSVMPRIPPSKVKQIRRLIKRGLSSGNIAGEVGLSRGAVEYIRAQGSRYGTVPIGRLFGSIRSAIGPRIRRPWEPTHVEPPYFAFQRVLPPSVSHHRRSPHPGDSDDPTLLESSQSNSFI